MYNINSIIHTVVISLVQPCHGYAETDECYQNEMPFMSHDWSRPFHVNKGYMIIGHGYVRIMFQGTAR